MINLKEDTQKLDEVVVVGYGVQKKSKCNGDLWLLLKTDDFNDLNMDVSHVIQGRVAGVNVSNGNIIIRGAASINGRGSVVDRGWECRVALLILMI